MASREVNLGFSKASAREGEHIIYVYNDDAERKRTMAQYLRQGIQDNEKVLYLVADISPEEMKSELEALGMDVNSAGRAFDLLDEHYKQCPGAFFEPDYMLGVVEEYYKGAVREGYEGARGAGEMSWAADPAHGSLRELVAYEARLNAILIDHPLTTVCQYDARLFTGDVILDLLSVHPTAIVRGQLVRNPFYIEPEAFLQTLAARPS